MSRKTMAVLCMFCFILSTLFFWQRIGEGKLAAAELSGTELGKLCLSQAYPALAAGERQGEVTGQAGEKETGQQSREKTTAGSSRPVKKAVTAEKKTQQNSKADNRKPLVIIYHTHTTESYQPYTESNFHRTKETGTVRDVGNELTAELNSLGIGVVHDKTVHDRPSYNQSYDRSLETVTALLEKYPTAKYVIDLHRDAAAYSGNVGKTTKIDGETVAKFSLVVGKNNANFKTLKAFAQKINKKAESMYQGFGGRVIEKTYRYNEYITDRCLLLEIGNNQNNIKEVRATGKYFARVLAEIIKEEQ